ncbi:MAG: hypothetical protein PHH59_04825 [Methylovulum sp.]|uniref:hypothetical protein n=1 Tax=Methylovulum sp. TaxID=1916980 RepID=UPI00260C3E0C|nr:hypothetical protein [Methylovulum sp.]MDD2723335.1 hypothetical protein [Methylovulum sp.]MDD5124684.1 hypothetical protein [Methylovulum sp.]
MKTLSTFTRVILAASFFSASIAYADPAHVAWADNLVINITPDKNEYANNPTYVYWAGFNGWTTYENRTQCSSFVTRLLKQAYNWTDSDFSQWFGSTSPTANLYHDAIEAQNGFTMLTNINDIQKGDILAVEYNEEDATVTGHVMMADDIAKPRTATAPIIANTQQFELSIIDSSKTGHGPADTRMMPDNTWDSGVGRGKLRLYADNAGTVVGYAWSTVKTSVFYSLQSTRHIVIGRLAN